MNAVVEQVDCETAEQFLERLLPQNPLWASEPSKWIFRGHARASWTLAARAHRGPEEFAGLGVELELKNQGNSKWINHRNAENSLIARFSRALNEAGFSIPAQPPQIRWDGPEVLGAFDPPKAVIPLLAL